ncbi:hypothetical protein ABS735_20045 [Streptomyces sp. MMCC 100]|uniref:hypothetical protein n=1 Tax=Streptomyces sp. MMCC 100 TaxID=3163555 RepID=UPI003596CD08
MRERSDGADEADVSSKGESRRIDLSVPQVAGSALAAVVAAKLASSFGVYGTIVGAGLISVVATCGGSVLQHFFKRTGEQIRVKRTVATVRIGGGTASVPAAVRAPAPGRASASGPASGSGSGSASGDFTEGTVYRARSRGWRRPVVAAALVFGVTMAGITVYEVASGQNLSGGHSTTVGSAFTGHNKSASDSGESGGSGDSGGSEDAQDGRDSGDSGVSGDSGDSKDSGSGSDAPAPSPSGSPDGGATGDGGTQDGGTGSSPAPTPDATGDEGAGDAGTPDPGASATAPEPGASSRSGTDGPGQDGPAAP